MRSSCSYWYMAAFALLLAMLGGFVSVPSAAQSFSAGYAKYQKGDFFGAESVLKGALGKATAPAEKAKILKFIGISQFMQGKKSEATASFKEALGLAKDLVVKPSEVLDDAVVAEFNKTKASMAPPPPAPAVPAKTAPKAAVAGAAGKAAPAAVTPVDAAAPVPVAAPAAKAAAVPAVAAQAGAGMAAKKPLPQTWLRIRSTAPGASVFIGGILAGPVDTPIEVDPGVLDVEVQAPGYLPRQVKIRAVENKETAFDVNLSKEGKAQAGAAAAGVAVGAGAAAGAAKAPKKAESSGGYFDDAGPGGDVFDEPPPAPSRADKRKPTKRKSRDDEMFGDGSLESGGAGPAEFERDATPLPPPESSYGAKRRRSKHKDQPNRVIALLPFGAGQFQTGRALVGGLLLVGQAGSLYYAYDQNNKAKTLESERDQFITDKNNAGETFSADDDDYIESSTAYAKKARDRALIGGIGFFALWVLGVVDELIYETDMGLRGGGSAHLRPDLRLVPGENAPGFSLGVVWQPGR